MCKSKLDYSFILMPDFNHSYTHWVFPCCLTFFFKSIPHTTLNIIMKILQKNHNFLHIILKNSHSHKQVTRLSYKACVMILFSHHYDIQWRLLLIILHYQTCQLLHILLKTLEYFYEILINKICHMPEKFTSTALHPHLHCKPRLEPDFIYERPKRTPFWTRLIDWVLYLADLQRTPSTDKKWHVI